MAAEQTVELPEIWVAMALVWPHCNELRWVREFQKVAAANSTLPASYRFCETITTWRFNSNIFFAKN